MDAQEALDWVARRKAINSKSSKKYYETHRDAYCERNLARHNRLKQEYIEIYGPLRRGRKPSNCEIPSLKIFLANSINGKTSGSESLGTDLDEKFE